MPKHELPIPGGRRKAKATQRYDEAFYWSHAWRQARRYYLAMEPWCADPYGEHDAEQRAVPAVDVHHRIPRSVRPDLSFDPENLEGLCKRCHGLLTAREQRG